MSDEREKGGKLQVLPAPGSTPPPISRGWSPSQHLSAFLERLGLINEIELLKREAEYWDQVRRMADAKLGAGRAINELRNLPQIIQEDDRERTHRFKMNDLDRKIEALEKGERLIDARRRVFETSRRFDETRNPTPPPPPSKAGPPPSGPVTMIIRDLSAALKELEAAELDPKFKEQLKGQITAAVSAKFGDMTI